MAEFRRHQAFAAWNMLQPTTTGKLSTESFVFSFYFPPSQRDPTIFCRNDALFQS